LLLVLDSLFFVSALERLFQHNFNAGDGVGQRVANTLHCCRPNLVGCSQRTISGRSRSFLHVLARFLCGLNRPGDEPRCGLFELIAGLRGVSDDDIGNFADDINDLHTAPFGASQDADHNPLGGIAKVCPDPGGAMDRTAGYIPQSLLSQ
jgi:hypothetical protein